MQGLFKTNVLFLLLMCCMDVFGQTYNLLTVKKETGVSFIDLWNLKGYAVNDSSVLRNCLIDLTFTPDCPSMIYILFQPKFAFSVQYDNFKTSFESWLVKPKYIDKSIVEKTAVNVTPTGDSNGFIFIGKSKTDADKAFFAVFYNASADGIKKGPRYYVVPHNDPLEIANLQFFNEYDFLDIRAKYNSTCKKSKPCLQKNISEIKNILTDQGKLTTKVEATTTTSDKETTTTTDREPTTLTDKGTTTSDRTTTTKDKGTTTTTKGTTNTTDKGTSTTTDKGTATITDKGTVTTTDKPEEEMCPCDCEFKKRLDILNTKSDIPIEELKIKMKQEIDELKKSLTVDVEKLASTRRKKISAGDKRNSSQQIGLVGATIIAIVFGLVILIDLVAIKRFYRFFRRNFLRN